MKNITIIVPIHEYNDLNKKLLTNALKSIPNGISTMLMCNENIFDSVNSDFSKKNINVISSTGSSFVELVNDGVNHTETDWFSILEFDDEYTPIWFKNFEKYKEFNPDVSVFIPLTDLFDFNEKRFIGYGNEAVWASSFSNEIGFIDNDCLQNFFDFYLTGSIFNTNDWKDVGGLKNSMKLTFWYEYLLRATYNGKKIFVIPRIGYVHNLNREGSLINTYSSTISEKESQQLIDLAKQEYFFKTDRNKTIEK